MQHHPPVSPGAVAAALSAAAAAFVPAVSAQSTIVSPVTAAAVEGSASNAFPWNSTTLRRYMQVHSDIGGEVKLIQRIAFRQNAGGTNYTGRRAVELEMFMGHGVPWDMVRYVFDRNYTSPRTNVVTRKVVNMGPQGQAQEPGPNAFQGMEIALDSPFTYLGAANSLVWEVVIHDNPLTGNWNMHDADTGTVTNARSVVTGAGCTATGRTLAMTHGVEAADVGGGLAIGFSLLDAPPFAPVALALGFANPSVTLPGLCSPVLTDARLIVALGTADGNGTIAAGGHRAFAFRSTSGGGDLYSQMHALDAGSSAEVPVANSDGRRTTLPVPDRQKQVQVSRLYNNVGGVNAREAAFFSSNTVGYGMVTRFTY